MKLSKRKVFMNPSLGSYFRYCPLMWVFFIVPLITAKFTGSTKDAYGLLITIHSRHLRSYLKRITVRSSRPEVFCKKRVLGNFAKFAGKHLYRRLFFNKVIKLQA